MSTGPAMLASLAIIAGVLLLWHAFKTASENAEKTEQERLRQIEMEKSTAKEKTERAEQERLNQIEMEKRTREQLFVMVTNTKRIVVEIPTLIKDAEVCLDKAQDEFAANVFAPFWDQVEKATNNLAAYHRNIRILSQTAVSYKKQSSGLRPAVQAFPISVGILPDARQTASRLASIVRKAQQNFQFATIYEQRRTNKLLYEGFRSLGDAIYSMGSEITSSLNDLSNQLHVSLNDLLEQSQEESVARRRYEEANLEEAANRRRQEEESLREHRKQGEMLDNIQRGRKPIL